MGRLKLTREDLFVYSIEELQLIQEGHEIDKRDDWERSRVATSLSLMPHLKKSAKLDIEKIWPLPWDSSRKKETVNFETLKEKKERAEAVYQKLKTLKDGRSGINSKDISKNRRPQKGIG